MPLSSRRLYPSARLVFSDIFHNFTVLSAEKGAGVQSSFEVAAYRSWREGSVPRFFVSANVSD